MNLDLRGKHALVGGSSKGIGRAIALELALLGADVTLMARTEELLQQAVASLDTSIGQIHRYVVIDVADQVGLQRTISDLVSERPVHILINNTGGPPSGLIREANPSQFLDAFQHHLIASHIMTLGVLEPMKLAGYGRIINIISTSVKQPLENLGVSNTIRGAVASWAKTMANELGVFGITVNNVLPGFTNTERLDQIIQQQALKTNQDSDTIAEKMKTDVPLRRFASASEIAAAVAFLASPAAAYISGINLPVDGGRTKSL